LSNAREASGAAAATAAVHAFAELVTEVLGERVEVHDISPLGVVVLRGSFRAAQEWSKLVTDPAGPLRTSRFRPDPTFPPLFHPHMQEMRTELRERRPEVELTRSGPSLEVHWRWEGLEPSCLEFQVLGGASGLDILRTEVREPRGSSSFSLERLPYDAKFARLRVMVDEWSDWSPPLPI
jgi:hypothetical protein